MSQEITGFNSEKHAYTLEELASLPIPKDSGILLPGIAQTVESQYVSFPDDGLVFVTANSAGHTRVTQKQVGQIYTTALAGCTGIAGIAQIPDGALAGVSHFDVVVEMNQRKNGMSASEQFIHQFTRIARHLGSQAMNFLVTFDEELMHDSAYGKRDELQDYGSWHFLDQLESLAEEAEEGVSIELQPYRDISVGHTIAATVNSDGQYTLEAK